MSRHVSGWLGWALALLVAASFCGLGYWQLGRMQQKRVMLEAAQRVLAERRALPLSVANDPARANGVDWVAGKGGFAARPPLLLDNQTRAGRAGVRVYRLFYSHQSKQELLVDMGWLPLQGARRMPTRRSLGGDFMGKEWEIRGLLAPPPSAGLKLGPALQKQDDGTWLMTRIDMVSIKQAEGHKALQLGLRVLKLDPALPLGYERDLDVLPNTMPPERHLGYAVQWFGLALAVLITALVLTLRRRRRR